MSQAQLDKAFWERRWRAARYATEDGNAEPNRTLTETAVGLPSGTALDAGCGEGADALWLATRGWTVTAADFVASALDRGRMRAERAGTEVARRIRWHEADLGTWTPTPGGFDLVSAHYLHGIPERYKVFRRLAAAVRPGGTLLIVGHHPSNAEISGGTMPTAVFFTTADVAAALDERWELVSVDDDVPRSTVNLDGEAVTLRSAMVRAHRRDDS
jgi:SAM-dependent methyltransferase